MGEIVPNRARGHVDFGWLRSAHSFSFGRYWNPDRMGFGALRVLNEDWIQGGQGFAEHFHDNMEIVTIPLEGAVRHGDSMGTGSVIGAGEVQAMSAGTGVMHSEHNASSEDILHLLQIWILPRVRDRAPRYAQTRSPWKDVRDTWCVVASPEAGSDWVQIEQDAWIRMGRFSAETTLPIPSERPENGRYLQIVSGALQVGSRRLEGGDALTVMPGEEMGAMEVLEDLTAVLLEVPLP